MYDRPDDRASEPREEERQEAACEAPSSRDARPHHMIVSDGELLDIGPNAEPLEDAAANADGLARRAGERARPRYGRRATDAKPPHPDAT